MELPAHTHKTAKNYATISKGSGNNHRPYFWGDDGDDDKISEVAITPVGENKPHENRPPYFALYILKKSKAACRPNNQ